MLHPLVRFLFIVGVLALAAPVEAGLFHPSNHAAASAFSSTPGLYWLNTDDLQLTGPGGYAASGVLSDGAAVFSFTDFLLNVGATINTTGSRPAVILSQSDMVIAGGGIVARAAGQAGGAPTQQGQGPGGGYPGFGFFGGPGGGGGYGGPGGMGQDNTNGDPGAGGTTYGDIATLLLGGSGGGGSAIGNSTAGNSFGGAGGGAIELGAANLMLIAGDGVNANGVQGGGTGFEAGGGGSGGGIRLHAKRIINTTMITANGGNGGVGTFENGGGGGGGRILISPGSGGFLDLGVTSARGGFGGSSFFGVGQPGGIGSVQIIPEPASLAMALVASGSLLLVNRKRRGA